MSNNNLNIEQNSDLQNKKKKCSRRRLILKNILIIFSTITITIVGFFTWFILSLFSEPDISTLPPYHPFSSAEDGWRYIHYYKMREKQWPVAFESRYVVTSYGKTYVHICGQKDAPNLVLMPGVGSTSLMWIQYVKGLSEHFRIYAIDNIYDYGLSVYTRSLRKSIDVVNWMDELFTALDLGDSINIMGLSKGGWETCQYVFYNPNRVNKAVLLAPAATVLPFPPDWAWRGILAVIPFRYFTENITSWACGVLAERKDRNSQILFNEIVDDAFMGLTCFKLKMPVEPTVLNDKELRSIKVPVLFLVGDREVLYSAQDAVHRLNTIAPQIKTEIISNASHDLIFVQPDLINKMVIEFLLKK